MAPKSEEPNHRSSGGCRQSTLWIPTIVLTLIIAVLLLVSVLMENPPISFLGSVTTSGSKQGIITGTVLPPTVDRTHLVPKPLLELGVYDESRDFVNERGIWPAYWNSNNTLSWGPCLPPLSRITNWQDKRNLTSSVNNDNVEDFDYLRRLFQKHSVTSTETTSKQQAQLRNQKLQRGGGCRPGFLIIGAGKCGTSSLYHYLVGHPRVLPAFEKQIHYFRYYLTKPLGWYYSFFPTTQSFLEHGGLMTGEASPGYLPYPQVVKDVDRIFAQQPGHGLPKIIVVGRNPIDRMYSSYRYNYVYPTLEYLRKGRHSTIPGKLSDEDYQPHLFSLQELVRAELDRLKACLTWVDRENVVHHGFGVSKTYDMWSKEHRFRQDLEKRNANANGSSEDRYSTVLPALVDLDAVCFGSKENQTVLRPQWAELQTQNPEKVIVDRDLHLTQAMIGRGLYTFPLEWWYLVFDASEIIFVCTEDLRNPEKINDLALQLGLPSFNFSQTVGAGAYNVGGHRGYDKATPWDKVTAEKERRDNYTQSPSNDVPTEVNPMSNGIPISQDLYDELYDFLKPFNERLFALTGKRCQW